MPVISRIGAKSFKVRLVYWIMFCILILGAITITYPLALMLVGSVKSYTDINYIRPYPQYWFDDAMLFRKYIESKYNEQLPFAEIAWWQRIDSWADIEPLGRQESEYLDEFLSWRDTCKWWWLGHASPEGKLLPINSREFRRQMYERFDGDLEALQRELAAPEKAWSSLKPLGKTALRYPQTNRPYFRAYMKFAETRPVRDRMIENPDGWFWHEYLTPRYTNDIEEYNKAHATIYLSYRDIFLTRHVPENPAQRADWEEFVRDFLPIEFIRLSPGLTSQYQRFLAAKYKQSIEQYNILDHSTKYDSFEQIPQPTVMPDNRIEQTDYLEFIRDSQACPIWGIEVYGPRQAFEDFVARRRGLPVEDLAPIRLPIAQADWHDCMANTSELRWEFTTRNYKYVLEYILMHGRGLINTVIYCSLAVGLALLVNPLAAYALSQFKPPSTYTVLLFCMATMAFPAEITMIPGFLLLKRFPLWPLAGGMVAFGVAVWLFSRFLKKLPELTWMALALAVGVLVGVWLVPAMIGKPHISLLNRFAALVLPGMANGYMIFLLKGFFDSLPRELYESAELDGAGEWTKFWSFTMALSKPILAVLALGAFTAAYSAFMMALIVIPDEKMWTIMVWLFQLQHISHQAVVYASLVIAAIPTFIVFVFCQGIIMRGIVVPVEK